MRSDQMVHALPPHKMGLRAPMTPRDQAPLLRMRTDVANCIVPTATHSVQCNVRPAVKTQPSRRGWQLRTSR
jgi:hypothetical protein